MVENGTNEEEIAHSVCVDTCYKVAINKYYYSYFWMYKESLSRNEDQWWSPQVVMSD